jgi:Leucine-rich repeat (LRR) protein
MILTLDNIKSYYSYENNSLKNYISVLDFINLDIDACNKINLIAINTENINTYIISGHINFNKFKNLKILQIINVDILELDISKLKQLEFIYIVCNPKLNNIIFNNCINTTLTELVVCQCNLYNFPYIDNFHNLLYLDCSNNKLTQLPSINNLHNLISLNCINNNIKSLPINIIHKQKLSHRKKLIHKKFNEYTENEKIPELIHWIIKKYYYHPIINYYNKIYL